MIVDGFDAVDSTSSPLRGPEVRFKDGDYYAFREKQDVADRAFAVLDKVKGWQKLEEGCAPEYVMQQLGQPRPPQPAVAKEDWPLNLNGQPEHPWKWTHYLYMLDIATGEMSTFSTNTKGGNIAIGLLNDQIVIMRRAQPDAVPVVALESREMPTQYGTTKPRPHFRLLSWRTRGSEHLLLAGPQQKEPEPESVQKEPAPVETEKPAEPAAATTRAEGMRKLKTRMKEATEAPWEEMTPAADEVAQARLDEYRSKRRGQ
jgi:hypothetical protein